MDALLSTHRDLDAAQRFFVRSREVVGPAPTQVTTDGHDADPRALRETRGEEVAHRGNRYLNKKMEQDHRGIKGRYHPLRGFGSVVGAARFCAAYDERRDYFRQRTTMHEVVPLAVQREQFRVRMVALRALITAASSATRPLPHRWCVSPDVHRSSLALKLDATAAPPCGPRSITQSAASCPQQASPLVAA